MLFNSLHFIVFFISFILILFSVPQILRKYWLFIASCYFYMVFKPEYLLILFSIILIDFFCGQKIEKTIRHKKIWLSISIISNLGILVFYKYFNFFGENINYFLGLFNQNNNLPILNFILPIGLSFHTFQAMSYTIEVYRGKQKSEKNILIYSLYVMYFPQLVAGPIERPQNLIHQLKSKIYFNYDNFLNGIFRMSVGFFKKVVIADRLALYTDNVFNNLNSANGLETIIATFFFSIQIYCDFSGYTDIAIGASKIIGIKLMENFNLPYFSKSIGEFWKRWHISLSSWFKDYLYIPLGGNKSGKFKIIFNIIIVFSLSGFWHGAKWNFIIWGLLHGIVLIFEKSTRLHNNLKFNKITKIILTFTFVNFAWIFFRANNLNDTLLTFKNIASIKLTDTYLLCFNNIEFIFTFLLIIGLFITEYLFNNKNVKSRLHLISLTIFFVICSYLFGEFYSKQFIYFQF